MYDHMRHRCDEMLRIPYLQTNDTKTPYVYDFLTLATASRAC